MLLLQAGSAITSILPLVLMVVVFYFFMIRPQAKKQREQNEFQKNLAKGSRVVTASGIMGKISKMDDKTVTVEVDAKTYIRFAKSAISKEMTDGLADVNIDN
jgi:preprotein translocase subunit YajC